MKKILEVINKRKHAFLKIIISLGSLFLLTNEMTNAQNELYVVKNNWLQYSDAQNSLYHYLTGEAFDLLNKRSERISEIRTKEEWEQRQKNVRQALWNVLGPFPEKTPLNAKVTGTLKKDGYSVENIIYESLKDFYVTASLFIPDNVKKPAPAILFCCGHSTGVYRLPSYQLPLLNLVKKGFIVLAIDPIGQGERLQYFNPEKGASIIGSSTKEHSYPSPQVYLIGKSVARYFLWDGIRGIDYLVSRKEVDPKRIGVHGLSGGGTQTAYISALDERVAASAPAGYITSYRRLMESVGVQDGEQNFYHGISEGIDHPDFIEIRAPKPTLIMATTRDFFSIQGARETYKEVKRIYDILGKPGDIEITEDDYGHGYTKKNREAMYAFFQRHLQLPGNPSEEEVDFSTAEELQKTSNGQLSTSLGGESVFSLNRKEGEKFINELQLSRNDLQGHLRKVVNEAERLSGYKDPAEFNNPVFSGRIQMEGYVVEKYFVKGNGDYIIPYILMVPAVPNDKALIYLNPSGKPGGSTAESEMEWFVKNGITVLAPDMLGTGEMGPGIFTGDAYIDSVSYNIWYTASLIGRSIVGIQAGDIIRLSRILVQKSSKSEVYGLAFKGMGPVLLHAAAFDPAVKRVALIDTYSSYQSVVMNRFYNPKYVFSMVPGALTAYDLPDLAASLAPKRLFMIGVTDQSGNSLDPENIDKEVGIIRDAYHSANADMQLNILPVTTQQERFNLYREWIK